jgi:hypothetical protein
MPYSGKYTLTTGAGSGPCSELPGDALGFGSYNTKTADNLPDLSQVSMAVRTTFLGTLVQHASDYGIADTTEGDAPSAFGKFTSGLPDTDGICRPDSLSAVVQDLPEVPADEGDPADPSDDVPAQPATNITENWTNIEVYVTAANDGTQVRGHYAVTQDGTCSAEYDVTAVFPQVYCGDEDVIPDSDDDDTDEPDDTLCDAAPHPLLGYGSGISPDYPVKCDPDLLVCVLDPSQAVDASAFPLIKKQ